jgi:hypothetical protein
LLNIDTSVRLCLLLSFLGLSDVFRYFDLFVFVGCRFPDGRVCLLLLDENALVRLGLLLPLLRFGNVFRTPDFFLPRCFGLTDGSSFLLFGYVNLRLVDGLSSRLFPDRVNVSGFIRDIGNINIDQVEADFVQLRGNVLAYGHEKALPILVDLLNRQRGNR